MGKRLYKGVSCPWGTLQDEVVAKMVPGEKHHVLEIHRMTGMRFCGIGHCDVPDWGGVFGHTKTVCLGLVYILFWMFRMELRSVHLG